MEFNRTHVLDNHQKWGYHFRQIYSSIIYGGNGHLLQQLLTGAPKTKLFGENLFQNLSTVYLEEWMYFAS